MYRAWISPGDLAFDIGADIGNLMRAFLALGARVVAVEPQPHCDYALRWHFKSRPNLTLIRAATSRDNSPKRLIQFDQDVHSAMREDRWVLTVGRQPLL
jgi:FkbM family methyltransferase